MSEKDAIRSSSPSSESSGSEGEYMVQDGEKPAESRSQFEFSGWNPEGGAGLQFLSLMQLPQSWQAPYSQKPPTGKFRVSQARRRLRRKEFAAGRTISRHILDEKKLRQSADANEILQVHRLLDDGVDVCSTDDKKRSALHLAAAKGNLEIVQLLLEYGANPNQKDIIGNTALHLAACTNHIPIITVLLQAGTDVTLLDNMGNSPLSLANSRLRFIRNTNTYSSQQMKTEVTHIIGMMREYLYRAGQRDNVDELEDICEQLQRTSTREEVDAVSQLLADFTSLRVTSGSKQPG